jgi:hypothetical protein
MEELEALLQRFITGESVERGLAFVPRPSDVFITPFAKCGTTWLQQMVHSLRTGGDLDFDDISRVVPWVETALDLGLDLEAPQRGEPRAFKSHVGADLIPKGGRYIMSSRDPRDAAVSMYRFFEGWFFEPGTIDIDTFVQSRGSGYFDHLSSWWSRRNDGDVLFLAYEHMKQDLPETVRRVADFIGVPPDAERLAVAGDQASLESMTRHKDKYADLLMRELSERRCGLPPGSDSAKVRDGLVGSHRAELSPESIAWIDAEWERTIGQQFGLADYDALLAELAGA